MLRISVGRRRCPPWNRSQLRGGAVVFVVPNMCVGSLLGIPYRPFPLGSPWGADPVPRARFFFGGFLGS